MTMSAEIELRCPIGTNLGSLRDLVRIHAIRSGLTSERADELVLAVNEAVTNVLDHGGKEGTVTVRSRGDGITVEVADAAGLLTGDHLAAAEVDPTRSHGFGLWVIQHLCDEVTLEQTHRGSLLTLHMRRRPLSDRPPARRDAVGRG
ncbi:ATP-binding protein [Nonomuraea sp. SYSU D8015]|uniref:ATP-binding protein n=1 Tax=Nonomuraea sp. SYSU D8015 TaxID=2593644 RepID=UPI001660BFA8|nr:ATP-binding protein [Nonomuraea sp. SYSU D8015]